MADLSPNIIGDYININDLNTLIKMQAVGYKARAHLDAAYEKLTLNTGGFEVQRREKISRRKGTVAELISDLGDFKAKKISGDRETHSLMTSGSSHQRDVETLNSCASNHRATEHVRQNPADPGGAGEPGVTCGLCSFSWQPAAQPDGKPAREKRPQRPPGCSACLEDAPSSASRARTSSRARGQVPGRNGAPASTTENNQNHTVPSGMDAGRTEPNRSEQQRGKAAPSGRWETRRRSAEPPPGQSEKLQGG